MSHRLLKRSRWLLVSPLLIIGEIFAQTGPARAVSPSATEEVIQLSQFTVSAASDSGYNSANTVGATRVNIAIKNVPITVVSLNAQFLQDTGAVSLEQAARYVSGVIGAGAPYSGQLTVRGQNTPGANFRDGVQEANGARGALFSDIALTERVEIIKGPAGTLYGSRGKGKLTDFPVGSLAIASFSKPVCS